MAVRVDPSQQVSAYAGEQPDDGGCGPTDDVTSYHSILDVVHLSTQYARHVLQQQALLN